MVRFAVSKFKNAIPAVPKLEECILDIPIYTPSKTTPNKLLAASENAIYYICGSTEIGALPLNTTGRQSYNIPKFSAHDSEITCLDCSRFAPSTILSGSTDKTIKVWKVSNDSLDSFSRSGSTDLDTSSLATLSLKDGLTFALFHPTVDNLIAYSSLNQVCLWDYSKQGSTGPVKTFNVNQTTSFTFNHDGSQIAASKSDGFVSMFDPRVASTPAITMNHYLRDCQILAPVENVVLSFGSTRGSGERKCALWDVRNPANPLLMVDIDSSKSPLIPFYDPDSRVVIAVSKGEQSMFFGELDDANTLSFKRTDRTNQPTMSCCTIPKVSVDVSNCEVIRVCQLNKSGIAPYKYRVARKTYSEFNADLFPDTRGNVPAISADQWLSGSNETPAKVSLNPFDGDAGLLSVSGDVASDARSGLQGSSNRSSQISMNSGSQQGFITDAENYSKFRHLRSTVYHHSKNFKSFNQINMKVSNESNGIQITKNILCVPITSNTGKIAALDIRKPCRISPEGPLYFENQVPITDFALDPVDESLLAALCENGRINLWKVPEDGLSQNHTKPDNSFSANSERSTLIRFHPGVKNMVITGNITGSVMLWDVENSASSGPLNKCQNATKTQVLDMCWNQDNKRLAIVSEDKSFHLFDPRSSASAVQSTVCFEPTGNARVAWIDENLMLVSGFTLKGNQLLKQYDMRNPGKMLYELIHHPSPAVLVPNYDMDNKIAYCSYKGGTSILPIEIRNDGTGFFECNSYHSMDYHLAVKFLRKDQMDIKKSEVARCIRLLKDSTEIIEFAVPRVHTDFFQDDLFPDTKVMTEYPMNCNDWKSGVSKPHKYMSLCPAGYSRYTENKQKLVVESKYDSYLELEKAKIKETKPEQDIIGHVMSKLEDLEDKALPQDSLQGISDSEWDD